MIKPPFILVFLFFLYTNFSFGIILNISAPDYKNQTITFSRKIDYLSNEIEIIDKKIIDSNGNVKLSCKNNKIELTELAIGRTHVMLYLDTATKQYNLFFPKGTLINNKSLEKTMHKVHEYT